MKNPLRATVRLVLVLLCSATALTQIRQIDRSKLPQDKSIEVAYNDLASIDQFARTYETKWRFPISKSDVQSRFRVNLKVLEEAQKQNPSNAELAILTGLAAHLAYNLDIEEAYEPAMKLLQSQSNSDFRAAWFLGIHQCQSNNPVGGMQTLLRVEADYPTLPRAFWQDYANCSTTTSMPVHAIRAYDKARSIPDGPPMDEQLERLARNRINQSSITATYTNKQAWSAEKTSSVIFTSNLCGESFATKESSPINIPDVTNGTCVVTIETESYNHQRGASSATVLLLTQLPKAGESLQDYVHQKLSNPKYSSATAISGLHCPVSTCLAFEIVTDKLYKSEGGAHLLALFFQSDQPAYPGLRFETPQPLPSTPSATGQPTFFRAGETLQRFPGTLYTFVALDANQYIYSRARTDFDHLLDSLVVDTK